jgi:hypothetical protein
VLLGLDAGLYARVFDVPEEEIRAGLAPAALSADPRVVGEEIAAELAKALNLDAVRRPLEPVPERFLEPYNSPRWAPVSPHPPREVPG